MSYIKSLFTDQNAKRNGKSEQVRRKNDQIGARAKHAQAARNEVAAVGDLDAD